MPNTVLRFRALAVLAMAVFLGSGDVQPLAKAQALSPISPSTFVRFDLESPEGALYPSDVWTRPDLSHKTGRRVNLPKPDCGEQPSACDDIDAVNTLDGFNLRPWLSVPLDGPIDPASATSRSVFLVKLGNSEDESDDDGNDLNPQAVVGINQAVWDPSSLTLHAEADELLEQHARYALIVTRALLDETGKSVGASESFERFRHDVNYGQTHDRTLKDYRKALLDALQRVRRLGIDSNDVVGASVFTTQSVTAILERIRDQIKAATPEPASFLLGPGGSRTLYPLSSISAITYNRQVSANPAAALSPVAVPVGRLNQFTAGAVGTIAFGRFSSPQYRDAGRIIPPIGTRTGTPEVQDMQHIVFNLFLPSGPQPAQGWPVAIFGHGGGNTKEEHPWQYAASLAEHGIATIAFNTNKRGFGSLSTLRVNLTDGTSQTFFSGGLSADTDGDGLIDNGEGAEAASPAAILGARDAQRQTVADLMQLVRVIQIGMDADGDGFVDLDASRIHYLGHSFGGSYGYMFLAVEPDVRAGVLSSAGGLNGRPDLSRMRPLERSAVGAYLASRTPSLVNAPGLTNIGGIQVSGPFFNENIPLRNQPVLTNDVEGAIELQRVFDRIEWAQQSGDGSAYAAHVRERPLAGVPAKAVLVHIATGDLTAPNPRTTEMIRAGDLADRVTYYRNDLAFAEDPARVPKNPHSWMQNFTLPGIAGQISRGGQQQVAVFFATDGALIIWPEPGRFFETPITSALPEDFFYIP
jgi:pimeloyl-ACP methyl ester carboxylesterase